MSNTIYKKDLHDIALAVAENSKAYTDKKAQEILWKIGEYDITTQNDNTSALVKTAPSGATRVKIKRVSGNCVKYAPSTASDDSVAKLKVIPENSYTIVLNTLGAMSYKKTNIIDSVISDTTNNGITYNSNGGITNASNTATANSNNLIYTTTLKAGTYYFKSFGTTGATDTYLSYIQKIVDGTPIVLAYSYSNGSFTLTEDTLIEYRFIVRNGVNANGIQFKDMLVSDSTAPTEFKQGFEGIRDTAVSSAVLSGSNLASIPNNTISSGGYLFNIPISNIGIGTYTVSFNWTGGASLQFRALKNNVNVGSNTINDTVSGINSLTITTTDVPDTIYLYSNNSSGGTASNIMLNKGSTALPYVPYIASITKTIPQEIQALEGYGWGINDTCYNYINLVNKKFVKKTYRVNLDSLTWIWHSNSSKFYSASLVNDIKATTLPLSNNYDCSLTSSDSNNTLELASNGYLWVKTDGTQSTRPSGYLYYELATPIETDISSYLPADFNKITTNDNYTNIEFISAYGYDIPNKVSYYGTIKETLCTAINKNDALAVSLTNNEAKYGWSVSNFYNTRDYTTNKGSQKVGRVKAKDLSWHYNANQPNCFRATLSGVKQITGGTPNILIANYTTATQNTTINTNMRVSLFTETSLVFIHDENFTDGDYTTFANHFTDDDYIYFELATEVVEDITPLENNVIEVVENDELGFVNSENQAVPSEITYRIEVEK